MNSSGIKRGLAGSAVAALAVTGLPFFASSADAAAGDTITVVSTGPARNGGDVGADVVIRVKDGTVNPADLALTSTTGSTVDAQNNADQNATILSADAPVNDPSNNAFDLITVHIAVTTSNDGDTASFRIFDNDGADPTSLEASEARATVSVTTAGAPATLDVAPTSQSTAQGIETGAYTATLKDSAGRTTQLLAGQSVALTSDGDITINESGSMLDADELSGGSDSFTVTPTGGAALGAHTITLNGPGSVDNTATVNVTPAANISSANMVDIVTGADSWDGFGGGTLGGTTAVRVDQNSIRIDFKGGLANAGATVSLNVDGDMTHTGGATDVTFGGQKSTTVTTVLDASGNGSVTITADALAIQAGDLVNITGSFNQTLSFERSAPTNITAEQDPYFGKLGGSVDVKVTVTDQFGAPVTTGFIGARRVAGPNAGDAQQAKAVDSSGSATFTFTDTHATNGQIDTVGFGYVADQFQDPATANPTGATHIKWTTDGQGANFVTSIGGDSTESPTYDPAAPAHTVIPLADTVVDEAGEAVALAVAGAEPNSTETISVDNGALILAPGQTDLSQGKSEVTVTLDGTGNLPAGYRLIGTKSGLTTVTVSAANRTETSKFTVAAQNDKTTARNVTVSGPATVPNGTTQIPFVAVVTDAFGNPVANVPVTDLNIQVSGPAQFQDSDAITDANGQMHLNVRVDAGAEGDVTIKVQGFGEQFGAAADQLTASSPANGAKGLPASSNVATATTTVEPPAPPVQEPINLTAGGKNNGGKADKLKVKADDNAAGLVAKVFVKGKKVAKHALNGSGDYTFTIKDKNGNKATKYVVKVAATETTLADQASKKLK